MAQLLYALQFKGRAQPANDAGSVLKAATSSPSSAITTNVGSSGVETSIAAIPGETARFESTVTMLDGGGFNEEGSISFGAGNTLRFTTVGRGTLGPSADPKLSTGAVIWQIAGGEGQFKGASGYITSNFSVSDQGDVVDNQFGVIYTP
ncbi:MAG TPA: hypothetical protein VKV26_12770 [Dehalococcoidia bacterium]|nr:hypothetical protein [Dehalococcoidia bacterium]